jgi:hypothetical protein
MGSLWRAAPSWEHFKRDDRGFFARHTDSSKDKNQSKQEAWQRRVTLLQDSEIQAAWSDKPSSMLYESDYIRQKYQSTTGRLTFYQLFSERAIHLLGINGICGLVLPSSFQTEHISKALRYLLLYETEIDTLLDFKNTRRIYPSIHSEFKFTLLTTQKGQHGTRFRAAFGLDSLDKLSRFPMHVEIVEHNIDFLKQASPNFLHILPFTEDMDFGIFEKILAVSSTNNVNNDRWALHSAFEFRRLDNRNLSEEETSGCLPVVAGRSIEQYALNNEDTRYWISEKFARDWLLNNNRKLNYQKYRLGVRNLTSPKVRRTIVGTIIPKNTFCAGSIRIIINDADDSLTTLFCLAILNSFTYDWYYRNNSALQVLIDNESPIPRLTKQDVGFRPIVERVAKLICTTPEFDDLAAEAGLGNHTESVTEPADRAQLHAELDGLIAHLYGLTEEEFSHILGTFPLVDDEIKEAALREYNHFVSHHDMLSGDWRPPIPLIITEGKTDWMHIKAAWVRLQAGGHFSSMSLELQEYGDDTHMGDSELLHMCKQYAKTSQLRPHIFVFDRDNPKILKEIITFDQDYRDWGNNVYSFALPIPSHRSSQEDISIELYYMDEEIKQANAQGRRLFLSDEFDNRTGYHMVDDLHCTDRKKYQRSGVVIDHEVFQGRNQQNVAMTKSDFAQHILDGDDGYNQFDISAFSTLFTIVEQIMESTIPTIP